MDEDEYLEQLDVAGGLSDELVKVRTMDGKRVPLMVEGAFQWSVEWLKLNDASTVYVPNIASVLLGGDFCSSFDLGQEVVILVVHVVGDCAMMPAHAAPAGVSGDHERVRVA